MPWKVSLLSNAHRLARFLNSFESLLDDLVTDDEKDGANDEPVDLKVINAEPLWQLIYLNVKVGSQMLWSKFL